MTTDYDAVFETFRDQMGDRPADWRGAEILSGIPLEEATWSLARTTFILDWANELAGNLEENHGLPESARGDVDWRDV